MLIDSFLSEWLLSSLSFLAIRVEKFSRDRMLIDQVSSLTAGFCVGILLCFISVLGDESIDYYHCSKLLILSAASYPLIAHSLQRNRAGMARNLIPHWILISILGSFLLVILLTAASVIDEWNHPETALPTWKEFIVMQINIGSFAVVALSILTLPITAVFTFAGSIVAAAKRWHNGAEVSISILPNQTKQF